jgi:hypothetical protein
VPVVVAFWENECYANEFNLRVDLGNCMFFFLAFWKNRNVCYANEYNLRVDLGVDDIIWRCQEGHRWYPDVAIFDFWTREAPRRQGRLLVTGRHVDCQWRPTQLFSPSKCLINCMIYSTLLRRFNHKSLRHHSRSRSNPWAVITMMWSFFSVLILRCHVRPLSEVSLLQICHQNPLLHL